MAKEKADSHLHHRGSGAVDVWIRNLSGFNSSTIFGNRYQSWDCHSVDLLNAFLLSNSWLVWSSGLVDSYVNNVKGSTSRPTER
jgi:hypothetical protein